MINTIKKIILGILGGMAILFGIAILLFMVWIAAYIGLALVIFFIGYFLVTQYLDYKSDVVKKMDSE